MIDSLIRGTAAAAATTAIALELVVTAVADAPDADVDDVDAVIEYDWLPPVAVSWISAPAVIPVFKVKGREQRQRMES